MKEYTWRFFIFKISTYPFHIMRKISIGVDIIFWFQYQRDNDCRLLEIAQIWIPVVQSTPVISRLLGAKICEREFSGSPVIAMTRDFQGHRPTYMTFWRLQLSNSALSDNKGTYVSRISTPIDITPATNHNKQH